MADKMAMKMGQRYLKKKLAGKQGKLDIQANQPQADNSSFFHYTFKDDRGKTTTKDKDVAYYTAQGVPAKDAKILLTVMHRARRLDSGIHFLWFKMGWSTVIGLAVPVAGDFIDAGLSYLLVIRKAKQVSSGTGKNKSDKEKLLFRMGGNVFLGFSIGLLPYVGEIVDTVLRLNTRSAKALEEMLLERVKELARAADAEKADVGMETAAPVVARNHATANTSQKAQPVRRTPAGQKSQPARNMPTRDDEQYGNMHKRIAAKSEKGPANKSQRAKSGGSWFGKRGAQTGHIQNGGRAEVAPVPPPRPAASERGDGWF